MTATLTLFLRFAWNALATIGWILTLPLVFLLLQASYALGRLRKKHSTTPAVPIYSGPTRPPCSVVIPNWNGRDLLEKYLPSVVEACDFSLGDEIIVVDNSSEDGSTAWLHTHHPSITVLPLPQNLGFGGGSNAGIRSAHNPIVVLLNSDMRVEPSFLQPLLEPFREPDVFAVSAQILFSDPHKRREESGLTYAQLVNGRLSIGHQVTSIPDKVYPCFYPGGGSSAFNRDMLLELGGFDHCFRPFYLEDTDLGFEAWRRGWRVLFQPASVVYHEHRGTIGKHFQRGYIDSIICKNRLLFQWKHLHTPSALLQALLAVASDLVVSCLDGKRRAQRIDATALGRALLQLPGLLSARFRSARAACHPDLQAIRLHRPDIYFDSFLHQHSPQDPLRILLICPYPLYPARHGGAVLITQTLEFLRAQAAIHLVVVLESEEERAAHLLQQHLFASMHLLIRPPSNRAGRFGLAPKAAREFAIPELHRLIHTLVLQHQIDVVQLEYTQMAQYAERYSRIVTSVFEHDLYFQTVARRIFTRGADASLQTMLEYLRALRFELRILEDVDYIQVCTSENAQVLRGYVPHQRRRIDANARAGIALTAYPFQEDGRETATLLFVGNFRHTPNREGLHWLIQHVMPGIVAENPLVKLRVVGANSHLLNIPRPCQPWIDVLGEVPDVKPHLSRCTLFVCPVLTGSGVRVKLLEAYASGIPVVSTTIGAEGLHADAAPVCMLADTPNAFANAVISLLQNPIAARQLAANARKFVEASWDAEANTGRVLHRYRKLLAEKQQRATHGNRRP